MPGLSYTHEAESPLLGKKILVTRPGEAGEKFASQLNKLGAKTILMPMIEIAEPDSWQKLDEAIANIKQYQWLLFASSNAVLSFVKRLENEPANQAIITNLPKIAVIGTATARTAKNANLKVDFCPSNFLAESFIQEFPVCPDKLQNINILWPRTNYGRDFITKKLEAAGATVHIVPAYKTELPVNAGELGTKLISLISNNEIDAITIASKQTAINLAKILDWAKKFQPGSAGCQLIRGNLSSRFFNRENASNKLRDALQDILIVTIGPETSEGALNYLGKVDKEASQHSTEGLINALIELL